MSAPVEVPKDIVERIRTLCLALPEVTVRVDGSLTRARSTAHSFDIRRRSFCLLVAWEDSTVGQVLPEHGQHLSLTGGHARPGRHPTSTHTQILP